MRNNSNTSLPCNCGCLALVMIFNALIGTWSVTYLVTELLHKSIPVLGALLIGLVGGEVTVPLAIIVWLLRALGVM